MPSWPAGSRSAPVRGRTRVQAPEAADADTRCSHRPHSVPRWHGHAAAPGRGAKPRPWAGASRGRWSARRHPRRLRGCRLASAASEERSHSEGRTSKRPGPSLALPSPGFCAGPGGSGSAWRPGTCELWSENGAACHASLRRVSAPAAPVDAEHHSGLDCAGRNDGPGERLRPKFQTTTAQPNQMIYLIAGPHDAEGQRGTAGVAQRPEAADTATRRSHRSQSVPRSHGHAAAPGRGAEPRPWAGASRGRWSARRHPRRLRGCRLASAHSEATQPQRGKPQPTPWCFPRAPISWLLRRARVTRLRMAAGHVRAAELKTALPATRHSGVCRRRPLPSTRNTIGP